MKRFVFVLIILLLGCGTEYDRYDLTGIESIEILKFVALNGEPSVLIKKDTIYQSDSNLVLYCKFGVKLSEKSFFIGHPHGGPFIYDSITDIQFSINGNSINNQLKSLNSSYQFITNSNEKQTVIFFSLSRIKTEHPLGYYPTLGVIFDITDEYRNNDSLIYSVEYELQSGKKFKKRKAIPIIKNDTIMNE